MALSRIATDLLHPWCVILPFRRRCRAMNWSRYKQDGFMAVKQPRASCPPPRLSPSTIGGYIGLLGASMIAVSSCPGANEEVSGTGIRSSTVRGLVVARLAAVIFPCPDDESVPRKRNGITERVTFLRVARLILLCTVFALLLGG